MRFKVNYQSNFTILTPQLGVHGNGEIFLSDTSLILKGSGKRNEVSVKTIPYSTIEKIKKPNNFLRSEYVIYLRMPDQRKRAVLFVFKGFSSHRGRVSKKAAAEKFMSTLGKYMKIANNISPEEFEIVQEFFPEYEQTLGDWMTRRDDSAN